MSLKRRNMGKSGWGEAVWSGGGKADRGGTRRRNKREGLMDITRVERGEKI
jgi:hypothetical protein